jgi:hypothetical protein
MPFSFVDFAHPAFYKTILYQRPQDAVERLLGHAENVQQVVDRCARGAIYEVHGAVMRATVRHIRKNAVRIRCKSTVCEKHCLNALSQLLVGQKQ